MTPSQNCYDLIKSFEGCFLDAYPDPGHDNGLPITIGWGSTTYKDGKLIKLGDTISQGLADELLAWEVDIKAQGVTGLLNGAGVTQNQFDAIVSFAYNVGLGNLASSTLLKKVKRGENASTEFLKWNKAGGKVMKGLTRRRVAERDLYRV